LTFFIDDFLTETDFWLEIFSGEHQPLSHNGFASYLDFFSMLLSQPQHSLCKCFSTPFALVRQQQFLFLSLLAQHSIPLEFQSQQIGCSPCPFNDCCRSWAICRRVFFPWVNVFFTGWVKQMSALQVVRSAEIIWKIYLRASKSFKKNLAQARLLCCSSLMYVSHETEQLR